MSSPVDEEDARNKFSSHPAPAGWFEVPPMSERTAQFATFGPANSEPR